ncbi:MAG: hypothetical protein ACFFA0_15005 [Promethearchaeota archaeon]
MKEFDHFRNTNLPPTFYGNPPPGGHTPPDRPKSPFGIPPFIGPPDHFRPPLPLTHDTFKEMKYFMILMILSENPEGITGYQLEKFHIPRGNMLRVLDDLEKMEYVSTSESVIKGRAQKFFIITEKGKAYLSDLKEKWSERLAQMIEFAGPHMMGGMLMRKGVEMIITHHLDTLKTKEDAIDLFRGLRSKAKTFIAKISERLGFLKTVKSELDSMIQAIEKMDDFDLEEIKKKVEDLKNKLHGEL